VCKLCRTHTPMLESWQELTQDLIARSNASGWTLIILAVATLFAAHGLSIILQSCRTERIRAKASALSEAIRTWEGDRIPVTIITGFLGSGKTTLLNQLLKSATKRICVIENEVGAVALDHELLRGAAKGFADDVFVLANGCICCSATSSGSGGELERVLDLILAIANARRTEGRESIDHVVIETSGLADPAPLVELFFSEAGVPSEKETLEAPSRAFELRGVVTVVDSLNALGHIDHSTKDSSGWWGTVASGSVLEATRQVAFADRVVLNKTDLASEALVGQVEDSIRAINPDCTIVRCTHAHPVADKAFSKAWATSLLEGASLKTKPVPRAHSCKDAECEHHHHHLHGAARAVTLASDDAPASSSKALSEWLSALVSDDERWRRLYRVKGAVKVQKSDGSSEWVVIQGVHAEVHIESTDATFDSGFVVLIGVGLEEERALLEESFSHVFHSK
jgi:G3E family GTPase